MVMGSDIREVTYRRAAGLDMSSFAHADNPPAQAAGRRRVSPMSEDCGSDGTASISSSGCRRQTLYSNPSAPQVMINPLPPALISGSESPLVGTLTVATAMLIAA